MHDNLRIVELQSDVEITWCSIFNTYRYFNLHKNESSHYFSLLEISSDTIVGICHFTEIEQGTFRSPAKGTFAGFELKENNLEYLIYFVSALEELLIAAHQRFGAG